MGAHSIAFFFFLIDANAVFIYMEGECVCSPFMPTNEREKKGKKKEIKGKTGREGKEKRKRKENGKGEKRKGKIGK